MMAELHPVASHTLQVMFLCFLFIWHLFEHGGSTAKRTRRSKPNHRIRKSSFISSFWNVKLCITSRTTWSVQYTILFVCVFSPILVPSIFKFYLNKFGWSVTDSSTEVRASYYFQCGLSHGEQVRGSVSVKLWTLQGTKWCSEMIFTHFESLKSVNSVCLLNNVCVKHLHEQVADVIIETFCECQRGCRDCLTAERVDSLPPLP